MKNLFIQLTLLSAIVCSAASYAAIKQTDVLNPFIQQMVEQHQFDKSALDTLFQSVEIKENILKTMAKPAEGLPWYKYRKIFLTEKRISGGIKFWQENETTLKAVEEEYGVPAEIIVSIIGVETRYGQNTGHHRVIDALATLGFAYPKRSKFFLSELKSFLILCRTEKMDPLRPTGSYAGAMGIPQFMPSSFLSYAADFEGDQHKDIWNNPADAIASVANYFKKHHWQTGQQIAFPVTAKGTAYKNKITADMKPSLNSNDLKAIQIAAPNDLKDHNVALLAFEQKKSSDLWLTMANFYVITRYNHSPLYAMAVFQLSQSIKERKVQKTDD